MEHLPVMYAEALQQLAIKSDGVYLDCTFGRGGHSQGILDILSSSGRLLAFDRDADAINAQRAKEMLLDKRFALKHSCFSQLENIVISEGLVGKVDGILLDLGVSSPQLDNPERGFSFLRDGPLDMRMDSSAGLSAEQWLSSLDVKSRYLTALWKAPIIVTTAVTFFETLASNSPSTLRRLHNLPGSGIFVDESHAALILLELCVLRISLHHIQTIP